MTVSITSATVERFTVAFQGGVAVELAASYNGVDSNGNNFPGVYHFAPTPTQQTNIDNFVNSLAAQVEAATGLTITLN